MFTDSFYHPIFNLLLSKFLEFCFFYPNFIHKLRVLQFSLSTLYAYRIQQLTILLLLGSQLYNAYNIITIVITIITIFNLLKAVYLLVSWIVLIFCPQCYCLYYFLEPKLVEILVLPIYCLCDLKVT